MKCYLCPARQQVLWSPLAQKHLCDICRELLVLNELQGKSMKTFLAKKRK